MSDLGNKQIMAENIRHYMEINGVDRNTLCTKLNIKYTTMCDWINAKTYPRIDKIEMMANFFGISKADLVEKREHMNYMYSNVFLEDSSAVKESSTYYADKETAKLAQEMFEDEDMRSLFDMKRNMPPERFKAHMEFMKNLYKQETGNDT